MILNPQQKAAVEATEKQVLVQAGPGSGKTRVIVERIAHLLENCKVSPYEIAAVTFTRLAAQEMRSRLEERVGHQANKITIGTFHAIALKQLHRFGELIGFNTNATVYGEFEERYLLKDVAIEMGYHTGKAWKKIKKSDVDKTFANYYQKGVLPAPGEDCYRIFNRFVTRCRENNSYTYGSLLTGFKMLLPQIKQYIKWKHFIIDETHDNDPLQWMIAEMCRDILRASLFVVADLDQSIYQWRGAWPEYLIRNAGDFKIYQLQTNYRSLEPIVKAANKLIEKNRARLPLEMKASRTIDGPSWENQVIRVEKNMDSEALVQFLKENDVNAVLCRVHGPLQKLSRLLNEAGIDHNYVGKKSKLTNSEAFRRFHAFLKLAVNPYDNFAFLLIRDIIGLDQTSYQDIRIHALDHGASHFEVWHSNFLDGWTEHFDIIKAGGDFNKTIEEIEFQLSGIKNRESDDFKETANFATDWGTNNPSGGIQNYLDWLATYDLQDELSEDTDCLKLMTIHAAKGLEWPTVLIAGANEGILPSKQAIKNDEIEQERNLAYVAWTRAENKLIITIRPEISEYQDKIKKTLMSRFVEESGI